jgi:hypothetical protein
MSDPTRMTELDLVVGSLITVSPKEDKAGYEEEREWVSDIQDLLREEGVEVDLLSRPGVEIWEGGIESFNDLYQLRLLAAYLENGRDVAHLIDAGTVEDVEPDPLLVEIWDDSQATRFGHLIKHQADGGYYLPVDFPEPIWLSYEDEEGLEDDDDFEDEDEQVVCFGSSVALQRELTELEPMLRDAGLKTEHNVYRCLATLRTAAEQSVTNDLPVIIW